MTAREYDGAVDELVAIYSCLCDRTRLRILHLLGEGPLCVCHLQTILGEPQVKVSKHLSYLMTHGMVEVRREGKWRIYRLAARRTPAMEANLACLQDCVSEEAVFRRDRAKLQALHRNRPGGTPACGVRPASVRTKQPPAFS